MQGGVSLGLEDLMTLHFLPSSEAAYKAVNLLVARYICHFSAFLSFTIHHLLRRRTGPSITMCTYDLEAIYLYSIYKVVSRWCLRTW